MSEYMRLYPEDHPSKRDRLEYVLADIGYILGYLTDPEAMMQKGVTEEELTAQLEERAFKLLEKMAERFPQEERGFSEVLEFSKRLNPKQLILLWKAFEKILKEENSKRKKTGEPFLKLPASYLLGLVVYVSRWKYLGSVTYEAYEGFTPRAQLSYLIKFFNQKMYLDASPEQRRAIENLRKKYLGNRL